MSPILLAASAAAAFAVALWLAGRFANPRSSLYILDHPTGRSLHSRPVPRSGGIALLTAIYGAGAVPLTLAPDRVAIGLGAAGLAIAALGFADDRRGLPPVLRFVVQLVIAGALVAFGLGLSALHLPGLEWVLPEWAGLGIAGLFLLWMINLYNFMDGMDGLAASMALIGFGALALLGFLGGNALFGSLCVVVVAAAGGFLVRNFPPARIFLGDAGSATLGLFAGGFALWGAKEGLFPLWVAVLVFAPFIADATVTLVRRLARGERVWEAHRTHYYQRLVQLGWGHKRTLLLQWGLMLISAAAAVSVSTAPVPLQWAGLGIVGAAHALYFLGVHRLEKRRQVTGSLPVRARL